MGCVGLGVGDGRREVCFCGIAFGKPVVAEEVDSDEDEENDGQAEQSDSSTAGCGGHDSGVGRRQDVLTSRQHNCPTQKLAV